MTRLEIGKGEDRSSLSPVQQEPIADAGPSVLVTSSAVALTGTAALGKYESAGCLQLGQFSGTQSRIQELRLRYLVDGCPLQSAAYILVVRAPGSHRRPRYVTSARFRLRTCGPARIDI